MFEGRVVDGQTSAEGFLNQGGQLVIRGLEVNNVNIENMENSNSLIRATGNSASVFIDPVNQGVNGMSVSNGNMNVSDYQFWLVDCIA